MRPWKRENTALRPLKITNMCSEVIHPAISTQSGIGPGTGGFMLSPKDSKTLSVSSDWQGRVWGRTNCTFDGNRGVGRKSSLLELRAHGKQGDTPVTLAEFTLDSHTSQTYYDISLVDGYNLDLAIVFLDTGNSTLATIPPNLTNPSCVASTSGLAAVPYSPYSGGSSASVLGTNASFPLPFENSVSLKEVSRWCPWDLQLLPPSKPGDGVYPYPDDNIPRPIFEPCYSACSKFNRPSDCCTGEYDSPAKCKPGMYSQNVKRVCPDAYSYAFDDQTSTFIIPSGGGFEIVFCPSGRSTNILSTATVALHQLAEGHIDVNVAMDSSQGPFLTKSEGGLARRYSGWLSLVIAITATFVLELIWR
ncbi:MAG: hypothetical protein M1840_008060 [Geoglossum simile]|nr:MAG: hypothetical protein M1840_008060 [Geoglossum simile]